jgi:hypothetical protein
VGGSGEGVNHAEICSHIIVFAAKHNVYRNCVANAGILVCSFKMTLDVLISERFVTSVAFESDLGFLFTATLYDN